MVSAVRGAIGPGEVVFGLAPGVVVGEFLGFAVVAAGAVTTGAAGAVATAGGAVGASFAAVAGEPAVAVSAAGGGDKLGGASTG